MKKIVASIRLLLFFLETTINSSDEDYKLVDMETQSIYSFEISLTIVGVKPRDLGNYTCEARNSYGTVRGTIQLESE